MGETSIVSFRDMDGMASVMCKSSMFKKNKEEMLSLMLIAQAEGLHPAAAAMEYDVIQGKPALKSQAALARFQAAGGVIEWVTRSDSVCEALFSHPTSCPKPVRVTWNMERAKRMGLSAKDNWVKQPGIMLQWRVVAEGVRLCYPACLNRMYLVEEVQDFDPPKPEMRDVTPEVPAAEPVPPAEPAYFEEGPTGGDTGTREPGEDAPEAQPTSIVDSIGKLATILGADALASARKTIQDAKDMAKSGAIDKATYDRKLSELFDALDHEVAEKQRGQA